MTKNIDVRISYTINARIGAVKAPRIRYASNPVKDKAIEEGFASYLEDLAMDDYYAHPEYFEDIDEDEDW